MERSFVQLFPITRSEHGLAKEFAFLALTSEKITEMTGIIFETIRDELDLCHVALLCTEGGKQFGLRNYFRASHGGAETELLGNERSPHPERDVEEFLRALCIPESMVKWKISQPNSDQAEYEE